MTDDFEQEVRRMLNERVLGVARLARRRARERSRGRAGGARRN